MSETICRTCLQTIDEPSDAYDLTALEANSSDVLTLGQKLAACVPELMEISTLQLVLCWACTTAVRCAYGFRQQCLETEERIRNYTNHTVDNGVLDLNQVISNVPEAELSSGQNNPEIVQEEYINLEDLEGSSTNSEQVNDDYQGQNKNPILESILNSGSAPNLTLSNEEDNLTFDDTEQTSEQMIDYSEIDSPAPAKYPQGGVIPAPILLRRLLSDHTYECAHCDYKTKKFSKFQVHKRTHNLEKKFTCSRCTFYSTDFTLYCRHIRKHNVRLQEQFI